MSIQRPLQSDWRALCLFLWLRQQKHPVLCEGEIFEIVARAYPHTAERLRVARMEKARQRIAEAGQKSQAARA